MTDFEFQHLRVGDTVEARVIGKNQWFRCKVVFAKWEESNGFVRYIVYAKRPNSDKTKDGKRYPAYNLESYRTRRCLSPLPANVYADWLDEQGESKAADMLRHNFPLEKGDMSNERQ